MIKVYDSDYKVEISDHVDLDEALLAMEEVDRFYQERTEKKKDLITVPKNYLFFAFLYKTKNIDEETNSIINEIIINFDNFSKEQQETIYKKISKLLKKEKILDTKIEEWILNYNPSFI